MDSPDAYVGFLEQPDYPPAEDNVVEMPLREHKCGSSHEPDEEAAELVGTVSHPLLCTSQAVFLPEAPTGQKLQYRF